LFLLNYKDKKNELQENRILKEELGLTDEHELHVHTGFYVAPNDKINQASPFPKLLLNHTIIDLIQKKESDTFSQISQCIQALGVNIDRYDYENFRNWSSFAFLISCIKFKDDKGDIEAKKIFTKHRKDILPNIGNLFLESLKKINSEIKNNNPETFDYYEFIKKKFSDLPAKLENYWSEVPKKYNVFGHIMGALLEEEIGNKEKFEEDVVFQNKDSYYQVWSSLISHSLRQKGVLIKFDSDDELQKEMNKFAEGLGHPDFVFVTQKYIFPIDSKLNINPNIIIKDQEDLERTIKRKYPLSRQISQKNLMDVFKKIKACEGFSTVFDGINIRGIGFVSKNIKSKAEKVVTPMQVLGKDLGKATGFVAQKWKNKEPITKEMLIEQGIKDQKILNKAVNVYNGMLKK